MALPYIFGAQTQPNLTWLDANFAAVGALTIIPCSLSGTNTITLTQASNTPTISAYSDYLCLSAVIAVDNTSAVNLQLGSLPLLPVYKDTTAGPVATASGNLQAGNYTVFVYDSTLNSGGGGFHVQVPSSGGGTGTVTNVATGTGLTGGPITGTGTISFSTIASLRLLANITGGAAVPSANTLTAILDAIIGTTAGEVMVRGASWLGVIPAAAALPLQSIAGAAGAAYGGVVSAIVSATGSVQGDAATIGNCNIATLTTVGAGTGIILPATTGLPLIQVINRGGSNLKVYPASGGQIEALGANNPDTVVATTGNAWYQATAAGQWYRTVAS